MGGCMGDTGAPPTGRVAAGNISALQVGTLIVMSNIVVARDGAGVYAMSAICTHQGCFLEDSSKTVSNGLHCPCHGSAFDGNGLVTNGPAGTALQHYAVTVASDGTITVEADQKVDATTRTAV
jgi:Rieske Fe-S protein